MKGASKLGGLCVGVLLLGVGAGYTAKPPLPNPGVACVSNSAELHDAIASAQPGDTILMCNGTWMDTEIVFDADGLPGQPITLRAEVDGQVRLEGESQLYIAGDYLVVQGLHFTNGTTPGGDVIQFRRGSSDLANHSRLTECAMTSYNPVDPSVNYKWVSVYGLHNRVDHCHFSGMNHEGVTLTIWLGTGAPANHTRIDSNYFGDRAEGDGNGFETIRIGTSTRSRQVSRALVESNYFYRCDGEIEIISSKTVGNLFRRNLFVQSKGQLTLRHGAACVVEGNYFLGQGVPGSSGVRVIGPDHVVVNNYFEDLDGSGFRAALAIMNGVPDSPLNRYLQAQNAQIAFNTFVDCSESMAFGIESSDGDTTLPPKDCVMANNVVLSSEGPLIRVVNEPENMLYQGNIFYGASTGIAPTPGVTVTDPVLVRSADGLMRPAVNSPVLDAAAGNYPDVVTDLDGDERLLGTQDVGADERVIFPQPDRLPFDPDSIGPRWMRPNAPFILGVTATVPGQVDVLFEDATGLAPRYTLERSEHLPAEEWTAAGAYIPVMPTSSVYRISDSVLGRTNLYWRVVNP